jgi:hypothetical protein
MCNFLVVVTGFGSSILCESEVYLPLRKPVTDGTSVVTHSSQHRQEADQAVNGPIQLTTGQPTRDSLSVVIVAHDNRRIAHGNHTEQGRCLRNNHHPQKSNICETAAAAVACDPVGSYLHPVGPAPYHRTTARAPQGTEVHGKLNFKAIL